MLEGQAIAVRAAGLTLFIAALFTLFACFLQSGSAYLIPTLIHDLCQLGDTHTWTWFSRNPPFTGVPLHISSCRLDENMQ